MDVAFDGDSLIKDYQNQFARIIDKEGVAGLMKKMDEKKRRAGQGSTRQGGAGREMKRRAPWAASAVLVAIPALPPGRGRP